MEKKTDSFGELDSVFIDRFLRREGEALEEAKTRILKERKETPQQEKQKKL